VPCENIEDGAEIYNATIRGENTRIGRGSKVGLSGLAHITDSQIGRGCELGAGTYDSAVLLDGAKVRGFAELRQGTLLEEQVEVAHSVALKNTILTATCVTGSLINFCDLFMSGGTSRNDHSEVGSGAIHFNFDPRGDKWGSLIGDARGLLLRSAPIFVGGHAGLTGPIHVDFGAVIAAGSIVRRDVGPDRVHYEAAPTKTIEGFDREIYAGLKRKFLVTAKLIGNLHALSAWYQNLRLPFAEDYQRPLYESAKNQSAAHVRERVKRLQHIISKLERSIAKSSSGAAESLRALHAEHRLLIEQEQAIVEALSPVSEFPQAPPELVEAYGSAREQADHLDALRTLPETAVQPAASWLAGIASRPVDELRRILG
jgi:UDP-N-acetylglucosamine/UDP-N-acetylgalactosamine diphosphorylase